MHSARKSKSMHEIGFQAAIEGGNRSPGEKETRRGRIVHEGWRFRQACPADIILSYIAVNDKKQGICMRIIVFEGVLMHQFVLFASFRRYLSSISCFVLQNC